MLRRSSVPARLALALPLGCAFLIPLSLASPQAASRPLWGALEPGPYDVGFRQLLLRDPTRPQLPTTADPSLGILPGRQMQVLLWYPAARGGTQLTYGDYIAHIGQRLDFTPMTAA